MKSVNFHVTILLVLLMFAFAIASCAVTPESYVIAKVNGQPITLKDMIDNPMFKRFVDQLVMRVVIKQKAAEEHIVVDEKEIKKRLDDMISEIGPGPSWERWKQMQNVTEENLLEQFRIEALYEGLLKKRVNVSEEEAKARFEQNPLYYRRLYATEHKLTDAEVEKMSFEDIKDWVVDYIITSEAYAKGQTYLDDIMTLSKVDYLFLPPQERARIEAEKAEKSKAILKKLETEKEMAEAAKKAEVEKGAKEKEVKEGEKEASSTEKKEGGTEKKKSGTEEKSNASKDAKGSKAKDNGEGSSAKDKKENGENAKQGENKGGDK